MVRAALEEAKEMCKAKLLHFRGKSEDLGSGEETIMIIETDILASRDEMVTSKSEASISLNDQPLEIQKTGCSVLNRSESIKLRLPKDSSVVSSPRPKQGPPSGKTSSNSIHIF